MRRSVARSESVSRENDEIPKYPKKSEIERQNHSFTGAVRGSPSAKPTPQQHAAGSWTAGILPCSGGRRDSAPRQVRRSRTDATGFSDGLPPMRVTKAKPFQHCSDVSMTAGDFSGKRSSMANSSTLSIVLIHAFRHLREINPSPLRHSRAEDRIAGRTPSMNRARRKPGQEQKPVPVVPLPSLAPDRFRI